MATGKTRPNKSKRIERNTNIAAALRAQFPSATLPIRGVAMRSTALAKAFDHATRAEQEVVLARAAYLKAVQACREANAAITPLIEPIRSFVVNTTGEQSAIAAAFGFAPRRVGKMTAEQRSLAVEKSLATRAARHTMGPRQKAAIHGTPDETTSNGPNGTSH